MNYVCLAAGKGTRFGNLGSYLQKCMYPVGLRPFLELSIRNLLRTNAVDTDTDDLTLVVGHHGEQLQAYFGSDYDGLAIHYVEQQEQLGTGHAFHLVNKTRGFRQPIIAWLADMYVLPTLFEQVQNHPEANVQTVAPALEGEKQDLRITTENGLVTRAWNGQEPFYDMGIWKLSPEVLSLMVTERHGEYRMVPNLQHAINQGHRLGFLKWDEWLHLGGTLPTPEANTLAVVARVFELEAQLA